jgi:hypothetical protein
MNNAIFGVYQALRNRVEGSTSHMRITPRCARANALDAGRSKRTAPDANPVAPQAPDA